MTWLRRVFRLPANESVLGLALIFCVISMSFMSIALVWQAQIIDNQREVIRWLERFKFGGRSEEHTSELQSHLNLVCRLLLEKKKEHVCTPVTLEFRMPPSVPKNQQSPQEIAPSPKSPPPTDAVVPAPPTTRTGPRCSHKRSP